MGGRVHPCANALELDAASVAATIPQYGSADIATCGSHRWDCEAKAPKIPTLQCSFAVSVANLLTKQQAGKESKRPEG